MEKILRIFGKEYGNINQAALLLGCFAFFSQILGLFRDRSLAHFIGPSPTLDIYYAAFRVPDLIFISVASLASITVLIPFILGRMSGDKVTDEARKYVSDIFSVFFVLSGLCVLWRWCGGFSWLFFFFFDPGAGLGLERLSPPIFLVD